MIRSVKISLGAATDAKLRRIEALCFAVKACTQRYIDYLWKTPGRLDAKTLNSVLGGNLSYRHRSNCLKIALETISATRKAAKALNHNASKPVIKKSIQLSSLVAKIEPGKGSFDYVLKLSGMVSGEPIVVPFKSHKRLNYWLSQSGAKLLDGCVLSDSWTALWIEIPDGKPAVGKTLAVDIGINKLIVDSDGVQYGKETKIICARVRRCKPGSKGKRRARRTRDQYINRIVKQLPWRSIGIIGVENLKGLKTGKKVNRSKTFRKAIASWAYRQALTRIELLAQENRVRLVAVNPRGTSRTCPNCGTERKENRRGEKFQCVVCNYSNDADYVGALNILKRTLENSGHPMVAQSQKSWKPKRRGF